MNNVFLRDGVTLFSSPKPCWELPSVRTGEYTQIPEPDNLPELFTLQTRRVLLKQEPAGIVEYTEYCGDLLNPQDAFTEPMTVWRPIKKKNETIGYAPRPHSPSRKLWRDFSAVAVRTDENRRPGIINWLVSLQENDCLEHKRLFRFSAVSALYDSSGSSVTNTVSDTLSFHADLLTRAGYNWQKRIEDQIQLCDHLADYVAILAGELALAAGKRETENRRLLPPLRMAVAEAAKEQYYFRVDASFRHWLLLPKADQAIDEVKELCAQWHDNAVQIARTLGTELVREAGEAAFLGRWITMEEGGPNYHYSSAEAFNRFIGKLNKV